MKAVVTRNYMKVVVAKSFMERLTGLIPYQRTSCTTVMLFAPCSSLHTFGMHRPIDVAFLDKNGCVLRRFREVPPHRILVCLGARSAIERFAASSYWPREGEKVCIQE